MESSLLTGGICNGAGVLVNSSHDNQLYCRCFDLYSGGSDFFDTRFVVPSDPTLSLTCSSSHVGEIVVWGLVLVGVFLRVIDVSKMFREKYQQFHERNQSPKTLRDYYKNFALRLLAFDLLVIVPVCTATAALKIAGHVMGTDIAVTLLFVLVVITFQFGTSQLAQEEFRAITQFISKKERQRLSMLRFRLDSVMWISYLIGAISPTIASLCLDKTLGPLANFEFVTILVRNIFVVCWSIFALVSNYIVFVRFKLMIGSIINSKSAEAVEHMQRANKKVLHLYCVISMFYVVFCIPSLWGFQTYCYAIIVFFGTFRSPAKAFKSAKTFSTNDDTDNKKKKTVESAAVEPNNIAMSSSFIQGGGGGSVVGLSMSNPV